MPTLVVPERVSPVAGYADAPRLAPRRAFVPDRLGRRRFQARAAGRVVSLETACSSQWEREGGGRRGCVGDWSAASRRRLFRAVCSLPVDRYPAKLFVTLTYPGVFPTDGRVVKAHLSALGERYRRRWGARPKWVWKMEYQERGAAHFHLLVFLPPEWLFTDERLHALRDWFAGAWYEVVGSGDLRHLSAGTDVQVPYSDLSRYFAYALKGSQNVVPDGFVHPGRVWGVWGIRPEWRGVKLTEADWVEIRRRLRRWAKSAGARVAKGGRLQGEWVIARPGRAGAGLLEQLARGLGRPVQRAP